MKLLVATRSRHKLAEIRRILGDVPGLDVLGLDDAGIPASDEEADLEPYFTFWENARSKAAYFRRLSGLPTVADDSGIAVDALDGAPGVHSKRFAPVEEGVVGEERDRANNAHLVRLLSGVSEEDRTARYVCVAALDQGEDGVQIFRGEAPGRIVDEPTGGGGFGYDPHFFDPELGRTFAEITQEEKNARSHRGKAFRALAHYLRDHPPPSGKGGE